MAPLLTLLSGLAWTIVYAESIRVGFRDKTYAMPIAALALNFAWESTYAVHDLMTSVSIQAVVNLTWALADLAIIYTFVKFGRAELPSFLTRRMFAAWGMLAFGAAYAVQWLFFANSGRMMLHATRRFCKTPSCRACLSRWFLHGEAFAGKSDDCCCEVAWDPRSNHSDWG